MRPPKGVARDTKLFLMNNGLNVCKQQRTTRLLESANHIMSLWGLDRFEEFPTDGAERPPQEDLGDKFEPLDEQPGDFCTDFADLEEQPGEELSEDVSEESEDESEELLSSIKNGKPFDIFLLRFLFLLPPFSGDDRMLSCCCFSKIFGKNCLHAFKRTRCSNFMTASPASNGNFVIDVAKKWSQTSNTISMGVISKCGKHSRSKVKSRGITRRDTEGRK